MLAPVLARLATIPGVTDARVECSGTYFLVGGADAATLERALPGAREVLGPGMRRVEGELYEAQLASRARGELWFSPAEIRALSYVEGRILAARMADAVTAAVPVAAPVAEEVLEATRAGIFAALDHAHDTGGRASTGWFWEEWPGIVHGIAQRLARSLPERQCAVVAEVLRGQAPDGA